MSTMRRVMCGVLMVGASAADTSYLNALSALKKGALPDALMEQVHSVLSASSATPAVRESMKDIVSKLATAQSNIRAAQSATNNKIDALVQEISSKDIAESDAKTTATTSDKSFVKCVGTEKNYRSAYDTAINNTIQYKQSEEEKCGLAKDNSIAEISVSPSSMSCNFGDGNCESQYNTLDSTLSSSMNTQITSLQLAIGHYKELKGKCDRATETREAGEQTEEEARSTWDGQITKCDSQGAATTNKMCAFKRAYDNKCLAIKEYNDFIALTKEANNPNSDVDRAEEWKAAVTVSCMMSSLLDKNKVDSDLCVAKANYKVDVGSLDYQDATVSGLSSNCVNTDKIAFTFSGSKWDKASPVTNADSYTKTDGYTMTFEPIKC